MKKTILVSIVLTAVVLIALHLFYPRDGVMAIDVSHHNKDVAGKVERYRPEIMIAKASEGTAFKDSKFIEHFRISSKNNILFGAYHFLNFDKDAKKQFGNYLSAVKSTGNNGKLYNIDIKPVLDVEKNPGKPLPGFRQVRRMVREFGEECRQQFGCYPIIYCDEAFRLFYFPFGFEDYVFWIRNTLTNPIFPAAIHQYKEDKNINLDFNRVFDMEKVLMS